MTAAAQKTAQKVRRDNKGRFIKAPKRGAKEIFEKRDALVRALRAIKHGKVETMPSRYHQHRLAEAGLIAFEQVQSGKRGRPQMIPHLTREGVVKLATI